MTDDREWARRFLKISVDHPLIAALPEGKGRENVVALFTGHGRVTRPYPMWAAHATYGRLSPEHMAALKNLMAHWLVLRAERERRRQNQEPLPQMVNLHRS